MFWLFGSRSGPWGVGVQSMGSEFLGCKVRVGTEWTDAVWKELLDSWESDESITISCPKVEQLGLILSGVCSWGSSEVPMRSALDLRMSRSGDDLVIVETVLLLGVESIKSAVEEDFAMMRALCVLGSDL